MSATLFLSGVAASFGARPLFSGLDLTIAPGDVVALIGPNGAGKTTLLRIVAGEHRPDAGGVRLSPADASVGYLPQSPPAASETILDYALRRTGVGAAAEAYEAAADGMASGTPGSADAYAHALDRWLALGGADLEPRLASVLARIGLAVDLDRPLGTLSGGQASRAALASVLVSRYDVLALDEPTNNLDAAGLDALTEFVRGVGSPVLVASHDRAFLDAVATSVCELDSTQQAVNHYAGGWTEHRAAKALTRRQAEDAYAGYERRRDALVEQARRQTEWARKGRAAIARRPSGGKVPRVDPQWDENKARDLDVKAARARDAVDRLEAVEQPRKEWQLRFRVAEAPPSADVVLTLDAVVARNGAFEVGPVSAQVERGARVALVGPNGSGKTTLLECVLGRRTPASGRISWGTRTAVGVLDQDRSVISGPRPLLEVAAGALGSTDTASVRTLLAKFGLGAEHVDRPCSTLSLGERTRAALAVLQGREVNVLVLDEPTNHADVEAIEQLQDALVAFDGTVLIVTHDRTLAESLAPIVTWSFERHGDRARVSA